MTDASLATISNPILLINLGTDASRPLAITMGPKGSNLSNRLPNANFISVAPASHFTFLDLCAWYAPAILWIGGEDPICSDPWFSNRAAVHDQIIAATTTFLAAKP